MHKWYDTIKDYGMYNQGWFCVQSEIMTMPWCVLYRNFYHRTELAILFACEKEENFCLCTLVRACVCVSLCVWCVCVCVGLVESGPAHVGTELEAPQVSNILPELPPFVPSERFVSDGPPTPRSVCSLNRQLNKYRKGKEEGTSSPD